MANKFIRANPNSQTSRKLANRTEDRLTPQMKLARDKFISEFLVDHCAVKAVIRSGGVATTAAKKAHEYMREPYVLQRINEMIDILKADQIVNSNRVLAGLVREANYQGIGASHGARVSAYGKLATILGMDAPIKHQVQIQGGVMVVPMTANLNDWETVAEEKQKLLKEDVRS